MKITTTILEPSGLTRWFESLAVFFSWGYSVLQLSLSCFICSELTADLLRSSNVSRFQQLVRLDLSSTYLYIVPPSRRSELSSVVNRGCVDVASNQPMANMQESDHYTQYKNLNVEVSTAFVFFICIFGLRTFNCNPVCTWSPTTSNDSRQLGVTLGCDPWSECLGGDVVNLNRHSLHLPAQLSRLSETWPLAPALRQNNNTMSRRLIEVVDDSLFTWTAEPTFSALLSACSSGSFFALKPFPTFPFPLHPWTSDFFVNLPCSPDRKSVV